MELGHTTKLENWLRLLENGQPEAREAIIEHTLERLRGLAHRVLRTEARVRSRADTGDLLQEAVIRLHRSLAELKPNTPGEFYGLASTQLRRAVIDLARKHFGPDGDGRHQQTLGPEVIERYSEPQTPDDWLDLNEAVESLDDEHRRLIDLLVYQGITQHEAATVLGVSVATLKRRWQDTRVLLRRKLDDQPDARL